MSKLRRAGRILTGLLMIFGALVVYMYPDDGMLLILAILSVTAMIAGINDILRYFFMSRNMVGGRIILYRGVILLNFGVFGASLATASRVYVALYLAGLYLFSGAVDVMQGVQAKKLGAGQWKLRTSEGVVRILLGAACIVFIGSAKILITLYCLSLLYSALTRIASAFRRTAVIFIQ